MTLREFYNIGWSEIYFRLYGVKWLSVDENGETIDYDYELIYDETSEKEQDITPFLDIVFNDIDGSCSEKGYAVLEVFEDIAPYKKLAKFCKEGVWERYKGTFWNEYNKIRADYQKFTKKN